MPDAEGGEKPPRQTDESKKPASIQPNSEDDEVRFSRSREVPSYKVRRAETEERKLRRQEIEAAKQSAEASSKSARWSVWAVIVGVAALAVAAWQQFIQR